MRKICKETALTHTTVVLDENIKRAHLQGCVWKHDPDPPNLELTEYDLVKREDIQTPFPVMPP